MKKIAYIVFFLLSTALYAQKVTTVIDTTRFKIGAEFKLTLKTSVDTSARVVFPNLKNIGALEVIRSYPIDTIRNNDRYELIKKYGLTQFDSGKYTIPRVSILINKKLSRSGIGFRPIFATYRKHSLTINRKIIGISSSLNRPWC